MQVAFDCDGTLKDIYGAPRQSVLDLFYALHAFGCSMFVWSGGGVDYAAQMVRDLNLPDDTRVVRKGSFIPDLAIDDQDVTLGLSNLKV